MQSLLVDINTAAITYRRECLQALDRKKYATCFGCIKAMNGLLPKDTEDKSYRIRISDDDYKAKVTGTTMARCNKCDKEIEREKLQVLDISLPLVTAQVVGYGIEKVWICPMCNDDNLLKDTVIIKNIIPEPFYSQIVPEPPRKKNGLLDQIEYHRKVTEWVWLCLDNLEESFQRYRKDYKPQSWELEMLEEIDNSLDEDNP